MGIYLRLRVLPQVLRRSSCKMWIKFSELWPLRGFYWCRKFDAVTGLPYEKTICCAYINGMKLIGWDFSPGEGNRSTIDPAWEYWSEKIKEPQ